MRTVSIANITIRQTENLYSLNDLHRASGAENRHKPSLWLKNQQSIDLVDEISKAGNPALDKNQHVIKVVKGGNQSGTFVCKELVYAYATWVSAKFFLQVIRTFDAVISGSLHTPEALPSTQTTIDERRGLVDAVKLLVARCGIDYSAAFRMVHQRFGVAHIDQIAAPLLPAAVAYVHSLTLQSGLNGEVLDRLPENMQPKPNGITFSEQQVSRFGTAVYFLDWATRQLAELSIPLKMLGAREKGVAAHTLWSESQSWLKHCRAALQEAQAQMHDPYYRDHLAGSLQKMADLSA